MDSPHPHCTGLFSAGSPETLTPLATPILLLAANAPDIDIRHLAGGPLSYLQYHRHLTHSLRAMPVLALATVALVRLGEPQTIPWTGAFCAALIAVATHCC